MRSPGFRSGAKRAFFSGLQGSFIGFDGAVLHRVHEAIVPRDHFCVIVAFDDAAEVGNELLDGEPEAADDGLATQHRRIAGDAGKPFG